MAGWLTGWVGAWALSVGRKEGLVLATLEAQEALGRWKVGCAFAAGLTVLPGGAGEGVVWRLRPGRCARAPTQGSWQGGPSGPCTLLGSLTHLQGRTLSFFPCSHPPTRPLAHPSDHPTGLS